jgi:hypothetical protein
MLDLLLPSLLLSLSALQLDIKCIADLFNPLTSLVQIINEYDVKEPRMESLTDTKVFESAHPYADDTDETHVMRAPKNAKWTLVFDSQCKTEKTHDWLKIYPSDEKMNCFADYNGSNSDWP